MAPYTTRQVRAVGRIQKWWKDRRDEWDEDWTFVQCLCDGSCRVPVPVKYKCISCEYGLCEGSFMMGKGRVMYSFPAEGLKQGEYRCYNCRLPSDPDCNATDDWEDPDPERHFELCGKNYDCCEYMGDCTYWLEHREGLHAGTLEAHILEQHKRQEAWMK